MNKYSKYLKSFAIVLGIVSILGGFAQYSDPSFRIVAIILGVLLIAFATSYVFRNFLFSLTFLGAAIASLDLIIDDSGVFDIAGLFTVLFCLGMGVYFGEKVVKKLPSVKLPFQSSTDISDVDSMTGLEFEQFAASLLSRIGYTHVSVTKASGDHGIDVFAKKDGTTYAIQCKNYTGKLDNSPVQEAYAGKDFYHCDIGVVITNSTFTAGAREMADALGVLLWDRQTLIEMISNASRHRFFRPKDIESEDISPSGEEEYLSNDTVIYTGAELQEFQRTHTLVDIIDTKVVGVTYANNDGTSRQDILELCSAGESVGLEYFEYQGSPAYAVMSQYGQIGNISAELASIIDAKYGDATVRTTITAVTGGIDDLFYGCNLQIEVYYKNPVATENRKINEGISNSTEISPKRTIKQTSVDPSFIAQAQWYAARGGADLIDDE